MIACSFGASLCSGAVALYWFKTFSFIGLVLNIILIPIVGLFCCKLGVVGIVLLAFGLDPYGILLQCSIWFAGAIGDFLILVAALPYISVEF